MCAVGTEQGDATGSGLGWDLSMESWGEESVRGVNDQGWDSGEEHVWGGYTRSASGLLMGPELVPEDWS